MNNNILTLLKLAAWGATTALVAGCSTDNYYQTTPLGGTSQNSRSSVTAATPGLQPQPRVASGPPALVSPTVIAADPARRPAWNEDRTSLQGESVYFDFSKASIKSSQRSKLNEVAVFLKGNKQVSIRIEGNCDERGTEEFNRELGVRRAAVSRDYLVSQGIDPIRIQTVSRGKDNPAVTGEDGRDRALNRRDEFVILTSDKVR